MSRQRVWAIVTPIVFGSVLLLVWQLFVVTRDIKPYLLPRPSAIWHEFVANRDQEWKTAKVTGLNAFGGLAFGAAVGVLASLVASRFRSLGELLTPLAIAVNAVPIIVMSAVFYDMFSATTETPRRLMAALVVFFVVFVNVTRGLTETSNTQLELMRSYAAKPLAVLWKVRIPNALPYFFTGLRIAAPLAVITALVAEYFGGLQNGLGNRIPSSVARSQNTTGWAYVMAACALGLAFYFGALVLERVATPWRARQSA